MDGKNLSRSVRQLLNESSTSIWIDDRITYDYLYEAAKEWVRRTRCLTNIQTITTVADQTDYTINGDYMGLFLRDADNKYYVKYTDDGSDNHFITFKDYSSVIYDDNDTSVTLPDRFTIADEQSLDSQISGTASADGDAAGGKSLLTTASDLDDVTPGDIVHNITDGSDGVVVSIPSSTTAYTCLFDGSDDEWDSGDSFIIQPRRRYRFILDPPPETAGETVTLYYVQKPAPVYSDYDIYNIAFEYSEALVKYAAWLYKYRDREPGFGDAFYQYWERQIRAYIGQTEDALHKVKFTISFKKGK